MQPTTLATLIIKRIIDDAGSTYDKLEARAVEKGISMDVFQAAMTIVHRSKLIEQSVKFGVIQYKVKEKKHKIEPGSHIVWARENYPTMGPRCTLCQHGCEDCVPFFEPGIDDDPKYLMMTREEFKAKSNGRTFIPRKKKAYEHARG